MMLAHLAVGYAGKKFAPKTSLGTLLLAGTFLDLLFAPLLLLGIEHARIVPGITVCVPIDLYHYPFSHSLLFTVLWAFLFRMVYLWRHKKDTAGGWVLFACVLSHWLFDVISHRPDMPILPFIGPLLGLGLWNSLPGTLVVELGIFVLAVTIYIRSTRPKDLTGTLSLIVIVSLQLLAYLGNMTAPMPPSIMAIAIVSNVQWVYILFGYYVDAHRKPVRIR